MDLQYELGITFIVVTHDQDEAMALATRIAVMDRGRVVDQIAADRFQSSLPQLQTHLGV